MDSQKEAGSRGNYKQFLAVHWIRQNRPDVWEQINKEAIAKYPVHPKPKVHKALPESLANLK